MTGAGKRLFSDAFEILTPELHKVGDKLHDATNKRAKVSRHIRESMIEAKGWLWNEGFDGCFLRNILRSHEIVTDPFASLLRSGNRDQKRPSAILHSSTSFTYSINHPAVFSSMLRRLVGHL